MPALTHLEQAAVSGFACVAQTQMGLPSRSLNSTEPFLEHGLRSSGILPARASACGSKPFLGSFQEQAAQK